MAPRLLATLKIDPTYGPLTQRDRDWLADLLSMIACELHKGEHTSRTCLFFHEPPKTYHQSLAAREESHEPASGS